MSIGVYARTAALMTFVGAAVGCPSPNLEPISVGDRVGDVCEAHFELLERTYRLDRRAHLRLSAGYLRFTRQLPTSALHTCEQRLTRRIRSAGIGPFVTLVVEHAHRLNRYESQLSEERLRALRPAVARALRRHAATSGIALIRSYRDDGYIAVSQNAALATAALMLAPEGRRLARAGATPESALRLVESYRQCRDADEMESVVQGLALRAQLQCSSLLQQLESRNPDGRAWFQGVGEASQRLDGGLWKAQLACLTSIAKDEISQIVDDLEERTACTQGYLEGGGDGGISPSGGLIQSVADGGYAPHKDGPPELQEKLEEYTLTEARQDDHAGPTGQGTMFAYKYTSDTNPDESVTVIEYGVQHGDTWASSASEVGTVIVEETDGGITTTTFDEDGVVRGTQFEGKGDNEGTFYQSTNNANGTLQSEVIVDEDGSTTVVEYDDEGNETKTSTYDTDGNCTSGCEDPATAETPPDEYEVFPCTEGIIEGLSDADPERPPLDPYILPSPDDATTGFTDSCLESLFSLSEDPLFCPASVALCIDPWMPDSSCQCEPGPRVDPSGGVSPNCLSINCGPDAACDPGTGLCQAAVGPRFLFPGNIAVPRATTPRRR